MFGCGPLSFIEIDKDKHGNDCCDNHDHDHCGLREMEGNVKENNGK